MAASRRCSNQSAFLMPRAAPRRSRAIRDDQCCEQDNRPGDDEWLRVKAIILLRWALPVAWRRLAPVHPETALR
jgi:hypothetical protein